MLSVRSSGSFPIRMLIIIVFALKINSRVCSCAEDDGKKMFHVVTEPTKVVNSNAGSHLHATREDIKILQNQINEKSIAIGNIHVRLSMLEDQTANLSKQHNILNHRVEKVSEKCNSAWNSIAELKLADENFNTLLSLTSTKLSFVQANVTQLESVDRQLKMNIEGLTGTMNRMNASLRHLHDVNQIWKNNFKIVNTTFRNLRKKVNFQLPAFSI